MLCYLLLSRHISKWLACGGILSDTCFVVIVFVMIL